MRPARAFCPSRLLGIILVALITITTAHYQGALLCQQPETQVCLTWLVQSEELQSFNNADSLSSARTRESCGFTKVLALSPYQKFYKVSQLYKNKPPKALHCKRIILIGLFVDWVETSYALGGTKRVRRQTFIPKGKYRGQTQSQYLAIDRGNGKDEGKAEAHSAADSSRASVSGNSGMGQAQSQSIYHPDCEDCYQRPQIEVENLKHPGSRPVNNGYGQSAGSTWPDVNRRQGYIPNHAGYNPIDTQGYIPGKGSTTFSGSQKPVFYGPKSKTNDGYGSTIPNDNIDYRPPGIYGRPIDSDTNGYGPSNNIGGYDTKNVPADNYKNTDNVGSVSYRPSGSGTNGYLPFGSVDSVRNVAPNTNGAGNIYTSGYPNRGVGLSPKDTTSGDVYEPIGGNKNRFGPGGTSSYDTGIRPGQGLGPDQGTEQGLGPGQGVGQVLRPGQGLGQRIGPGQGAGQGIGPGLGSGQGIRPGQGVGQGIGLGPGAGQGIEPGQGSGQGIGPGQGAGLGVGPGHGAGQGIGPGQGAGQEIGPEQGAGTGIGPGQGAGQGTGPNQGIDKGKEVGQGIRPGQGQGLRPGSGQGLVPQQGISQILRPGQKGTSDNRNGLPSTEGEYGPYQGGSGTGYRPNQDSSESRYSPDQSGLRPGQISRDTNWPTASGPYAGPGGSNYYCCFVPKTGTTGDVYPNNNGITNAIHRQSNFPAGQSENGVYGPNGVNNQYGTGNSPQLPVNHYDTGSGRNLPPFGHLGTGISNGPPTGNQYGPGGSKNTLTQPSQYGTEFDNTSPLKPGEQFTTGISNGPNFDNQYTPGVGTGRQPSNYGTGIDSSPGMQLGRGVSNGRTIGSSYEPGVGSSNLPNGQISTGSGPSVPERQYSTNVGNVPHQQYGTFNPNEYNGRRVEDNAGNYNRQPLPGGQYNNGVNRVISPGEYGSGNTPGKNLPGTQYNTGIDGNPESPYSKPNTPLRQYGTGTSQSVPGTQVGTGTYMGHQRPGTQFGPVDNDGFTSPGQHGTGSNILDTNPSGGQNEPVGTHIANYPGSRYGSFGGPEKSYGLGTIGRDSPTSYSGGLNIHGQPYGTDRVKVPSYGTDNLNYNSNTPGGTYQRGNIGGENGGVTGEQGSGIPNTYNGAPSDGTLGSHYGPYNPRGTGVQNNEYSGGPQNYVDPNSIDGDDSEAEASVAQGKNGTIASASSKGGNDKGRAQTNVHGTYTGTGSFQAQAQITGDNKEAQSEVSGGKKGASSTASGSGRNNKSQASVQLGSETGSVQTQSQSAGVMHSSNSQVQGSVKGGMADAQAKGPGSTSSQAQIGFTPYKDTDKSSHDLQKTPFAGGGVASAQSSGRTGQSQSQLHGTFKYGITYNGAAQSGASLDKDTVFPNRLSFEKIDVFDENEKNVNVDLTETPQSLSTETESNIEPSSTSISYDFANEAEVTTTENIIDETMANSESSHTHLDHHKSDNSYVSGPTLPGTKKSFSGNRINNPGTNYEFSTVKEELPPEADYDTDEPFNTEGSVESELGQEEYSNYDEFTSDSPTHQSLLSTNRKPLEVRQSTGGNTQHIVLGSLKNQNAEIIQKNSDRPDENKVYLAGERIPGTGGYTVPAGFTGSVKSVASKDNTYVVGYRDSPSQAQTVTLTPGRGKVKYTYPPTYGKHVMSKNLRSLYSPRDDNKYLSVSKSVTRSLDDENNIRKQYSHTYYTKSSSCGYFTFTCTMVSSAEGQKRICKPKMPTNPDGTQIRC